MYLFSCNILDSLPSNNFNEILIAFFSLRFSIHRHLNEERLVEKTLSSFIDCGKVPRKLDCVACLKALSEALKDKTWKAVKFYVKNRITIRHKSATVNSFSLHLFLHIDTCGTVCTCVLIRISLCTCSNCACFETCIDTYMCIEYLDFHTGYFHLSWSYKQLCKSIHIVVYSEGRSSYCIMTGYVSVVVMLTHGLHVRC